VIPPLASALRGIRGSRLAVCVVGCSWLLACAAESVDTAQMLAGVPTDDTGATDAGGSSTLAGTSSTGGMTSGGVSGTSSTAGGGGASGSSSGGATGGTGGHAGSGGAAGGTGGATGGGGAGGGGTGGGGGANGNDTCPEDPDKTAPGKCGCGVPDVDSVNGASCVPLQDSLIHRYSFEADANDSVGTAHGQLMGGASVTGGALNLAGGTSGQYLNLPNALISTLTNATIEAYVTWTGAAGGDWQRVFDFGSSDMVEDTAGAGAKYLFLSARTFRACYTSATPKAEIFTDSSTPFPATAAQVAVVVNAASKSLSLYLDGNSVGSTPLSLPLSAIDDVNNWLGRSQYASDEYFGGKISEFRIYSAALTGPELKTSKKMGENTTYLKK
jgi:Concanavalin A-like lectin/glucanases superfamily